MTEHSVGLRSHSFSFFLAINKESKREDKKKKKKKKKRKMIVVDNSQTFSSLQSQEREVLKELLENPTLISASNQLKSSPERTLSENGPHKKHVYVFQREFATVDPSLVQFVGTDESTTCVGLVIRNRNNGMTSISHMDFPGIINVGLDQMLHSISNPQAILDVHIVGGFDDSPTNGGYRKRTKKEGYSLPLCREIVNALLNRPEKFHLKTLCVLGHNTHTDSQGHARPIVGGILVDTKTGQIMPACFDNRAKCPDDIVRRILIGAASDDPIWRRKMLEIYDTSRDLFIIPPIQWSMYLVQMAFTMNQLSDSDILLQYSTSPFAEPPHFVESHRRIWKYLLEHPDWQYTFPAKRPRVFVRHSDGNWTKHD
ncbi:hypothetical protein LUZ60_017034 [Juncus effusus]|nr:hypothetical protein LUZ60_017034 [Juncus effusus]